MDREHERDFFQQEIHKLEQQLKNPQKLQSGSEQRNQEVTGESEEVFFFFLFFRALLHIVSLSWTSRSCRVTIEGVGLHEPLPGVRVVFVLWSL